MKNYAIATILLKALGVYLLLRFLSFIPVWFSLIQMGLQFLPGHNEGSGSISTFLGTGIVLLTSILYLCLSWFLLFRTKSLARFFVRDLPEESTLSVITSESFQTFAFQCLGVYAIVNWAPPFVQSLVLALIHTLWPEYSIPLPTIFSQSWIPLIAPLLGMTIGLLLLFKGQGLIRLIKWTSHPPS